VAHITPQMFRFTIDEFTILVRCQVGDTDSCVEDLKFWCPGYEWLLGDADAFCEEIGLSSLRRHELDKTLALPYIINCIA